MPGFTHRPIGDALLRRQDVPVLILEGARAVGKTTMMRRQFERDHDYSYVTFADRATLEFARLDPEGWLGRLTLPVVIDEAQLLPELPLVLKEFVDRLGPGNHVILTGSASIGRTGLGGADPLTRRSDRLTMHPLTSWEIRGNASSIVDGLFSSVPAPTSYPTLDEAQLLADMSIGGFPAYVFPAEPFTKTRLGERVRSDVAAVLSDTVLPGSDHNATIARAALDALLRLPGGIFNASRLARGLDLDRRTIDRYLGIFARLFLIHWLSNLATSAARQGHSRAKIHAMDTSFAIESLGRAGVDIAGQREVFGALLESHVVNQIVASSGWARTSTSAHYWRQASRTSPEVDLVLIDGRDRAVGIEIKASRTVENRDLRGLRALDEARGLHRGFLVYLGDQVRQLDKNLWALPVSALSDGTAFPEGEGAEPADDDVIVRSDRAHRRD